SAGSGSRPCSSWPSGCRDSKDLIRSEGDPMRPDDDRLLDLLERWEEAQQQGTPLSLEDLCAACPELLGEVKQLISKWKQLAEAFPPRKTPDRGPDQANTFPETQNSTPTVEEQWPTVPGYEIVSKLKPGGTSIVYKARQRQPNRPVALKM